MKEAKEMMIRLPMVTAQTADEILKARIYQQSGRYIVRIANGDIVITAVELRPIEQGEAQSYAEENDRTLAMRRMELEQEYEMKKMQLELDTPKRFAQGEWVSGKTLTEIIRTLVAGKKED